MLPPAASVIRNVSFALLLTLVALTDARTLPGRSKQVKVYSYLLPAGAEEIRDDINHSFACGNRSDGFYVDMDNDCQIFHRCQDHARFSFICAERTVFSQMYQTCVHDGQLGYPCENSAQYYPESEGYEPSPALESSRPEKPEQQAVPAQEPAAPQAPSKSSEMVVASADGTGDSAATNQVEHSQDSVPLPSEQSVVKVEDSKDEEEHAGNHHQMNADLFDSVEEESDKPSENSAQEVMDDEEPTMLSSAAPAVTTSSNNTSQEDTQELEIVDDATEQPQIFFAPKPSPATEFSDGTQESDVVYANPPVEAESEVQDSTPAALEHISTQSVQSESQYHADSLLNAVQTVEELEPIVYDIVVELSDGLNALQPQVAEIAQDQPLAANVDAMKESGNEVLPELETASADMEMAPLMQMTSGEVSSEATATLLSGVESDQQVNELSPEPSVDTFVDGTVDESSETIIASGVVTTDSSEPEHPASEPETDDAMLDREEVSPSENEQIADESAPFTEAVTAEQSIPHESPAIVEEMTPQRLNDSVELPELIVSTEFHLEAATKGPAIRRRKTFLFRADAIRSRQ